MKLPTSEEMHALLQEKMNEPIFVHQDKEFVLSLYPASHTDITIELTINFDRNKLAVYTADFDIWAPMPALDSYVDNPWPYLIAFNTPDEIVPYMRSKLKENFEDTATKIVFALDLRIKNKQNGANNTEIRHINIANALQKVATELGKDIVLANIWVAKGML